MKQFNIIVKNKIGSLADVTGCLAKDAVNIKAIATESVNAEELTEGNRPKNGLVKIVTDDLSTTRNALEKEDILYSESDLLSIELMDRPGELSKIAKKLASEGVNVESIYILGKSKETGKTQVALTVSDMHKANSVLKSH